MRDERLALLVARAAIVVVIAATIVVPLSSCSSDGDASANSDTSTSRNGSADATDAPDPASATDSSGTDAGEEAEPVALDATASFGSGVSARLTEIEPVTVEGRLPGERSGPGVAITVEITNGSSAPIDLGAVVVDLVDADGTSATPITSSEGPGLSGKLASGGATTGRYLYVIDPADRAGATVRVSYTASAPTVLFTGSLPDA